MHFQLRNHESAKYNGDLLEQAWQEQIETKSENASIMHAIVKVFGVEYAFIGVYKIIWGFCTWLCAY